jgi:hypothetical protein
MLANTYDDGTDPMRRAIRYLLLTIAGMILGLPLGLGLGHRAFDEGNELFSDVLALSEYETLAGIQYKESDVPHARQALLDLLKFMDGMKANNRLGLQKSMSTDRGIAFMRLALLEEKAGNTSESREYVRKAQEAMKNRDGSVMSEDRLRELVTKYDNTPTYKLPSIFLLSRKM